MNMTENRKPLKKPVKHRGTPGANLTYLAPQDNFSWVPNRSFGPQK